MVSNSNNWQTEAELRNKRKAKADSMQALLDHVDWNPDTLEISLQGITLKWEDIEGADNVVTKDDMPIKKTEIGDSWIITDYLEATNLAITGGSVELTCNGTKPENSKISLEYASNYAYIGAYGLWFKDTGLKTQAQVNNNNITIGTIGSSGTFTSYCTMSKSGSIAAYGGSIYCDTNIASPHIYKEVGSAYKELATVDELSNCVKYTGNTKFGSMSGTGWYVMAVKDGELHYVTKAQLQSYLEIG